MRFLRSITSPNGNGLCGGWTTTCRQWRQPVEKTRTRGQCTNGQRKAICLNHFDFDHRAPWNDIVTEIRSSDTAVTQSVPDWRRLMVTGHVLRIWESTAFDVSLTAGKTGSYYYKSDFEELAATCQRATKQSGGKATVRRLGTIGHV